METDLVYHITQRPDWEAALKMGIYATLGLPHEGFIHCSFVRQLERVANKYYLNQADLVILVIDPQKLSSPLKVEKALDVDDHYPHIYGPLNLGAVIKVVDFPIHSDQLFHLPDELT